MSRPLSNITNNPNSRLSMGPQRKSNIPPPQVNRQSTVGVPRPSLGPRPSISSRTSSIGVRQSAVGARQSSIGGRRSNDGRNSISGVAGPIKDPRNIADKDFQRAAVHHIISYLSEAGYPKQLTAKMMSSPSTREFLQILEFMYQQYDGSTSYRIGQKPEEYVIDVVYIFQQIGYPFALNKSNISTVGAQHAWPAYLAALDWFVGLLQMDTEANLLPRSNEFDGVHDLTLFDLACQSYASFLSGVDDNVHEEVMRRDFESKSSIVQGDLESLIAAKEGLDREIHKYAKDANRIADLENKKMVAISDAQKFATYVAGLTKHKADITVKHAAAVKECEQREQELAQALEEKAKLEAIVAQQEENCVDAAKINKERILLEESLVSAARTKEQANNRNWDAEMQSHKKADEILRLLSEYEALAVHMSLLGPSPKFANGVDYRVAFSGASSETTVCAQLKEKVKPGLRNLKEKLVIDIIALMTEKNITETRLMSLRAETTEKKVEIETEDAKFARLEAFYQKEKERFASEIKEIEGERDRDLALIDRLKHDAEAELLRSKKAVEHQLAEKEELGRHLEQQKREFNEAVIHSLDRIATHKEVIHRRLQDVYEHHRRVYANLP